ncbi:MAG: hypothetical protein RIQ93_2357 [Verrucomicrobiota bacterium]
MISPLVQAVRIAVTEAQSVSGLLQAPRKARACFVFAHGAGAGMTHPFMVAVADDLARHGIATLRYQFVYLEQGSKRPDAPQRAHAVVRAAVREAARLLPEASLFAGGKSFGGRMTSQAQAISPLPAVRGLVFLGFPLHPAGQPATERATHLFATGVPLLFLQGTRDKLADPALLAPLAEKLGARATVELFREADHSFHAPVRSGQTDVGIRAELADTIAEWMGKISLGV